MDHRDISDGGTRIVALPIDPYTVHVYWEVEHPTWLEEPGTRPALRFTECMGPDAGNSFHVDIDLQAGSCYVPLWSPDKCYTVDLGLRRADGRFVVLARSNTVRTPRAWPMAPPQPQAAAEEPAEAEAQSRETIVPAEILTGRDPVPAREEPREDLTELNEKQFVSGISSPWPGPSDP